MKQQPVKHYKRPAPWKPPVKDRVYLDVPFDEKEAAKVLGAWWDNDAKRWFTTVPRISKFPQVCRWMFPGEQKLLAKQRVAWLQQNDQSELVNIEAILAAGKAKAEREAMAKVNQVISLAMAK